MASETTAAAAGATGQVRRDPMAMKPFCGYNFADYFQHWLNFSQKSDNLPKIFHVNWFRKNKNGEFIWPGFGENMRVLEWILGRCSGSSDALETPIGFVPRPEGINFDGLDLNRETVSALLDIDPEIWAGELCEIETYFETYAGTLPEGLLSQLKRVKSSFAEEAAVSREA
jgi:phosphoenolpyruvate carboxykinase (GTP)